MNCSTDVIQCFNSFSQDVSKNKLVDSFVAKFKQHLKDGLEAVTSQLLVSLSTSFVMINSDK